MEHGDYPLRLQEHLSRHGMPEQTIANIGRMCRVSLMSEQKALELLEEVEAGRKLVDSAMAGAPQPDAGFGYPIVERTETAQLRHTVDL
jgi:hypothetical protein